MTHGLIIVLQWQTSIPFPVSESDMMGEATHMYQYPGYAVLANIFSWTNKTVCTHAVVPVVACIHRLELAAVIHAHAVCCRVLACNEG